MRVVKNLYGFIASPWINALSFTANITKTGITDGATLAGTGAGVPRGFWAESVPVVAGKRYAVTCDVSGVVGLWEAMAVYNGTATTSGVVNSVKPISAVPAFSPCVAFTAVSTGYVTVRVGVNINGTGADLNSVGTFSRLQVNEIPASRNVPDEWTFPLIPMMIGYERGYVVANGVLSKVLGSAKKYNYPDNNILIFGDSFGNDPTDWPQVIGLDLTQNAVYNNSLSGETLAKAIADFSAESNLSPHNNKGSNTIAIDNYVIRPKSCVIARGLNDISAGATASVVQSRISELVSLCAGMQNILILDIPPWKGHVAWSTAKEAVREGVNAWLESFCDGRRIRLFKISDVLKDGTDAAVLAAAYDSGDHLHPNATGSAAIAAAITPYLMWGYGPWSPSTSTLPALTLSPTAPGDLKQVQAWSKVASAKEIGKL